MPAIDPSLFSDGNPRRSRKSFKWALGIGVLATTVGLGTTLAANITLNGSAPVEFGQGVALTTSCETSSAGITVTPVSSLDNTSGNSFILSEIDLSNIDSACFNNYLKISVWDNTTSNPLTSFYFTLNGLTPDATYGQPSIDSTDPNGADIDPSFYFNTDGSGQGIVHISGIDGVDWNNPGQLIPLLASNVYKLTLESSPAVPTS